MTIRRANRTAQSKAKLGSLLFRAMHWCRSLEDVDQQVEPRSQLRWLEKSATIVIASSKDDHWKGMALFGYTMHISEVLRPDRCWSNLFNGRAWGNQGKQSCNHSDRNGTTQTQSCAGLWLVFESQLAHFRENYCHYDIFLVPLHQNERVAASLLSALLCHSNNSLSTYHFLSL